MNYIRCPLYDLVSQKIYDASTESLTPMVTSAINLISRAVQEKGAVLVHCRKGESRSACIVILYLMRDQGHTLREALQLVARKRPTIRPNDGFLNSLMEYETKVLRRPPSFTFLDLFCSLCGHVSKLFISNPLLCGHGSCCDECRARAAGGDLSCALCLYKADPETTWD